MAEWYISINSSFSITSGMWGKYFKKYFPAVLYEMYEKTYSDGNYDRLWAAIFTTCDLFHILAKAVASHCGFQYRQEEEDGMREYLRMMKRAAAKEQF